MNALDPKSDYATDNKNTDNKNNDKDEQEAIREAISLKYGNGTLLIAPLSSGRFAVFDRSFSLISIYDEAPSSDEIRSLSQLSRTRLHYLSIVAKESRFYGEPEVKDLARDLRQTRKSKPKTKEITDEVVDIDLLST